MSNGFEDPERISGYKEEISNEVSGGVLRVLQVALTKMDHPGEKACLVGGTAATVLAGLGVLFGQHEGPTVLATPDDVIFGACYTIAAIEKHPEGLICAFNFMIVDEAQRLFKTITGREYPLNRVVADALKTLRDRGVDVPEDFKKFVS